MKRSFYDHHQLSSCDHNSKPALHDKSQESHDKKEEDKLQEALTDGIENEGYKKDQYSITYVKNGQKAANASSIRHESSTTTDNVS